MLFNDWLNTETDSSKAHTHDRHNNHHRGKNPCTTFAGNHDGDVKSECHRRVSRDDHLFDFIMILVTNQID